MRASWDEYFMGIARAVARRATCDRKHVGCVLVDAERCIVSTGYNGSARGLPHCDDVGHDLVVLDGRESCVRVVHSEINAIAQAARGGRATNGATAYVTLYPCWPCARALANAGIRRVVYAEMYKPDERVVDLGERAGISFEGLADT